MRKSLKFLIPLFIFIGMFLLIGGSKAQAATVEELQTQIQASLNQIQSLQKQIAELQGQVSTIYNFARNLTLGSRGDDVKALQQFLKDQGPEIYPEGLVTGYFGSATQKALAHYQAWVGISPAVGYFGSQTREAATKGEKRRQPELISVISPNGGETWYKGNTYSISFRITSSEGGYVSLLIKDSTLGIHKKVPFDRSDELLRSGTYTVNWTIPQDFPTLNQAKISAAFDGKNLSKDESDSPFSIISSTSTTNLPPVITGLSGPTQLKINEIGTWTIKAYDPEYGYLSYSIDWGDTGPFGTGKISPVPEPQITTFTHSYSQTGTYTIKITVTDDQDQSAVTTVTVIVKESVTNQPPIIDTISGPALVKTNQAGSWTIKARDPEGGVLTYQVVNWGDGTLVTQAFVSSLTFSHAYSKPGAFTITFRVYDGAETVSGTSGVTVYNPISVNIGACGDIKKDSWLDIGDVEYLAGYILQGGPAPTDLSKADVNGDGGITLADVIYLSNYILKAGSALKCPATQISGTVLNLQFDEGNGSVASDSSGKGNNGTVIGATWINGKSGKALSFNGVSDRVVVNDSSSLDLSQGLTIEGWVKLAVMPNKYTNYVYYGTIVKKWHSYGLRFAVVGNTLHGHLAIAKPFPLTSFSIEGITSLKTNWVLDRWYHIAFTYDKQNMKLYVDGVLDSSIPLTGDIYQTNNVLSIGNGEEAPGWSEGFQGAIDELKIYNRALLENEIKSLAVVSLSKPSLTASVLEAFQSQISEILEKIKSIGEHLQQLR